MVGARIERRWVMSSEAQTSYHGIAARLDRIPITGMHRKVLWLLAGITFCDSVDMGVGGPIGAVLQSTYDAAGNQWMTLEQFALFNSITMIGYLVGGPSFYSCPYHLGLPSPPVFERTLKIYPPMDLQ